ncbi:unnamed protein product [Boreogadus saida]
MIRVALHMSCLAQQLSLGLMSHQPRRGKPCPASSRSPHHLAGKTTSWKDHECECGQSGQAGPIWPLGEVCCYGTGRYGTDANEPTRAHARLRNLSWMAYSQCDDHGHKKGDEPPFPLNDSRSMWRFNSGKCTDCTKLQQTVALFETRLVALEKCKELQDTVPMGEFAELTQIQHDDQSYIVSFPKLDKRETVPAASHWHRVGAKPKQHTKVNQQVHSTPLKLTLPLKNRFLPLQESTNAPATHAPLSPEMRPDGQCGQRRNNQSPRRRAVHVSATVQQGPISEKADEPDTLIIGDSTIKDITGKKI